MTLAYIAIGSNLASPLEQVNAAVNALAEIPDSRVISVSSFYRTPPLGPQDQPDYLNLRNDRNLQHLGQTNQGHDLQALRIE